MTTGQVSHTAPDMPQFDLGDFVDESILMLLDNPAAMMMTAAILFLIVAIVLNEARLRQRAEAQERAAYRLRKLASAAHAQQEIADRAKALRIVAARDREKGGL